MNNLNNLSNAGNLSKATNSDKEADSAKAENTANSVKSCRLCGKELNVTFADLGMSPLANSYIKKSGLNKKENFYPLHTYVCGECFLVQLEQFETPENIFSDYAYFSSYSTSWLKHCEEYVEKMQADYNINKDSIVFEIASNDGYLLQYFKKKNIEVLGIEPAKNVAAAAEEKGIPTETEFWGKETAEKLMKKYRKPNLILGNNVLAHVPDINDFIAGVKLTLAEEGIVTMEFPHLLNLMEYNQFDTIYHEHFSYLSLTTVKRLFEGQGLKIFNVEKLKTHGGSLRIYGCHKEAERQEKISVKELLWEEEKFGIKDISKYQNFAMQVKRCKFEILKFLTEEKLKGKTFAGYGAAAKGNTLFNYCGIGKEFIDFTVDRNIHKQNTFLPGTHIDVKAVEEIKNAKPDYLIIVPWNLKEEIIEQCGFIKEWGGKFVTLIPEVKVI